MKLGILLFMGFISLKLSGQGLEKILPQGKVIHASNINVFNLDFTPPLKGRKGRYVLELVNDKIKIKGRRKSAIFSVPWYAEKLKDGLLYTCTINWGYKRRVDSVLVLNNNAIYYQYQVQDSMWNILDAQYQCLKLDTSGRAGRLLVYSPYPQPYDFNSDFLRMVRNDFSVLQNRPLSQEENLLFSIHKGLLSYEKRSIFEFVIVDNFYVED